MSYDKWKNVGGDFFLVNSSNEEEILTVFFSGGI